MLDPVDGGRRSTDPHRAFLAASGRYRPASSPSTQYRPRHSVVVPITTACPLCTMAISSARIITHRLQTFAPVRPALSSNAGNADILEGLATIRSLR
ncbi:hypothetical protein V8E36_008384 [Tilletia maclaganii]